MTREEAIRKAYSIANMPIEDTSLKELIDEIYDDFDLKLESFEIAIRKDINKQLKEVLEKIGGNVNG